MPKKSESSPWWEASSMHRAAQATALELDPPPSAAKGPRTPPTWSAWVADRVRRVAIPPARRRRRSQLAPCLVALVVAFSLGACSATHQEVQANGDVLVRTGTTALGTVAMFFVMVIAAIVISGFLIAAVGGIGSHLIDSARSRKFIQAVGWTLSLPLILGLIGAMAWGMAATTAFRYQTSIVTASSARRELKVEQKRLLGGDAVRTWEYDNITQMEFDYIPASGSGDDYAPPQGMVYVRGSDRTRSLIFSGSACPGRDLADAVALATNVPIRVHSGGLGGRDIASVGSFLTQIRCGLKRPFHATDWRQYPAEAGRVLDLPFLWRWPWAVPIVAGQLALIAGVFVIVARWRASTCPTPILVCICVVAGLGIAAMHVFATKSYGSWPGALALFALISGSFVSRRLLRPT
jgi:hypothetical protein